MSNLDTEKDIARFFSLSSVNIRPQAIEAIFTRLSTLKYSDEKRKFLDLFLKYFKEWQSLNQKSSALLAKQMNTVGDNAVLDVNTVTKILGTMSLADAPKRNSSPYKGMTNVMLGEGEEHSKKKFTSFKQMKKVQAKAQKTAAEDVEMQDSVRESLAKVHKEEMEKQAPMFQDKVLMELSKSTVVVDNFKQFPKVSLRTNGAYEFDHYSKHQGIRNINSTRMDYYKQRLAQAEERIFSHVDIYCKGNFGSGHKEEKLKSVSNLNAVLGSSKRLWVYGLLSQREDGNYYLEDGSFSVRVSFAKLEFVEPDAFFTEHCVVLAQGEYMNETFQLIQVMHPPLHANKHFKFKINEQDYFGSYVHLTEQLNQNLRAEQNGEMVVSLNEKSAPAEDMEPCIVIVSQVELDQARQIDSLKALLQGIEQMRPEVLVLVGSFISTQNNETQTFEHFKQYFEQVGQMVRDLECLRDLTQWILMPSPSDPGVCKVFPNFKMSDFLITSMKGNGPQRIKKIQLATNPMRLSFRGKEVVFSRFDYFKKLKKNHLEKFQAQQDKQNQACPDTFKVAKTILNQGSLLPLPAIVQPIMWSYGDSLHLYPHPDVLVLADQCEDYFYHVPVNGHKTTFHDAEKLGNEEANKEVETVTVVNPGNFSFDRSFTIIYPLTKHVEPSKVPAM